MLKDPCCEFLKSSPLLTPLVQLAYSAEMQRIGMDMQKHGGVDNPEGVKVIGSTDLVGTNGT